jgi:hypothetical protein
MACSAYRKRSSAVAAGLPGICSRRLEVLLTDVNDDDTSDTDMADVVEDAGHAPVAVDDRTDDVDMGSIRPAPLVRLTLVPPPPPPPTAVTLPETKAHPLLSGFSLTPLLPPTLPPVTPMDDSHIATV